MAKETVRTEFAKAAFDAKTGVELSRKTAGADARVTFLVPKKVTAHPLWFPSDVLPLYQCMGQGVLFFSGSLWMDEEFAASYRRRPVHF